nr:hypothetical protein [uncultured Desulfobacter sp.]
MKLFYSIILILITLGANYAWAFQDSNTVEKKLVGNEYGKWVYDEARTRCGDFGFTDNVHCLYDSIEFGNNHIAKVSYQDKSGKHIEKSEPWKVDNDNTIVSTILIIGTKKYILILGKDKNGDVMMRLDEMLYSKDQPQNKVVYRRVRR